MSFVLLFLLACLVTGDLALEEGGLVREIPFMEVPELIRYWGYDMEEHFVQTADGYIQGIHRVPYGRAGPGEGPRPVVFMQHCLCCSSAIWVFGPPEKSLAFILADAGYDVWMGNARGNTYSRSHAFLDPDKDKEEFWDFDWHETAMYDVPSAIDHILRITGQEKVKYVGHSMGCTEFLTTMTMRPEYNEKVTVAALLAPPAYMSHAPNPIFLLAGAGDLINSLVHLMGMYEFLPNDMLGAILGHAACNEEHPLLVEMCANFAYLFMGMHYGTMNKTMISVYLDHLPEGTSTRPFLHYAQLYLSANFEAFDFGNGLFNHGNEDHYGTSRPPVYDLSRVTVPTALFQGSGDDLADPADVDILAERLPNCIKNHLVDFEGFSHGEFFTHTDVDRLVYDYVLDIFKQYEN